MRINPFYYVIKIIITLYLDVKFYVTMHLSVGYEGFIRQSQSNCLCKLVLPCFFMRLS